MGNVPPLFRVQGERSNGGLWTEPGFRSRSCPGRCVSSGYQGGGGSVTYILFVVVEFLGYRLLFLFRLRASYGGAACRWDGRTRCRYRQLGIAPRVVFVAFRLRWSNYLPMVHCRVDLYRCRESRRVTSSTVRATCVRPVRCRLIVGHVSGLVRLSSHFCGGRRASRCGRACVSYGSGVFKFHPSRYLSV